MVATKNFLIAIVSFFILPFAVKAQQCGNCKQTPSVAQYDLDVQVLPPDSNAKEGWLEWRQLFWLGRHANSFLFNNNKNCIRFTQPASADVIDEFFITE